MVEVLSVLIEVVGRHAPADSVPWWTQQLVFDEATFHVAFAAAGRRLGRAAIGPGDADRLRCAGVPWSPDSGVDECGRAGLVLAALGALAPGRHVALVRDLIRRGEVRERHAVLRVLAGAPDPARFVDVAVDTCRSNVSSVFEAIACDNAYPVAHFPDPALHQMVLKALFTSVPLSRIVNLQSRITAELRRMVDAFASERRAAGRSVPDDVGLVSG